MTIYTVVIPGVMRGKQRARFSRVSGRAYTPTETVNLEAHVKACAISGTGSPHLTGAVSIDIAITCPIPPSWSKRKQLAALTGAIQPTGKPDFDNTTKLISDAMNGIVFKDDAQITKATFEKRYGEVPRTVVRICAVGAGAEPARLSAPFYHHSECEFWVDQYPAECTCGVSRPKAEWFDAYVAKVEAG